jgi:hypothetical protein
LSTFPSRVVADRLARQELSDLAGLVVETWDSQNFQVTFDGTNWCTTPTQTPYQPPPGAPPPSGPVPGFTYSCGAGSGIVSDFSGWQNNPQDNRRNVMINFWDMALQRPMNLVYEVNGPAGPGFYEATQSPGTPHPVRTGSTLVAFPSGAQLWVNIGGPVYLSWNGTGWVKKTVASFDT